ncbi:hypothetical protein HBA55_05810 [Pseudomaricurvus alkylphenolicus]|uniref:hypothetical protein n=1 Tax=Pseudomaricurvus alkylphenolicus TaxID=1306991 RepID=UPI001422242C|nr:hypothetical protein [Pseudomaricurvus alkylphenolicus]NIB39091.1 hypothetical protein [Pseudomaricurvus alkylphenolicus]
MDIGIDTRTGRIFEGQAPQVVRELNPTPLFSPCKLVTNRTELSEGPDPSQETRVLMFREDFFDPKSRIRRGRIYRARESQPLFWHLPGPNKIETQGYNRTSIWAQYIRDGHQHIYVLLGDKVRFTVWKLIDLEVMATKEELITIKAVNTFGLLPDLIESEVPTEELPLIRRKLDLVVDDLYVASAESVVDCCREAVSAILGAYLEIRDQDLSDLSKALANTNPPRYLAKDLSNVLALLHPRRKASEERRRGTRRITDEDAQLAVSCLSTIMIELGWGRW